MFREKNDRVGEVLAGSRAKSYHCWLLEPGRVLLNICFYLIKYLIQLIDVIGFVFENHSRKSRSALSCAASVAARVLRALR